MQYRAQLDAMFPKLPGELSFDGFQEQMQRFGFVDKKELSDTFKRFASYSGKMQFRDFAFSLLPPDKRPTGNAQHEAETSHDEWDLGLGATSRSICSSVDLGATGRTAGRATQLKNRMKKRRAASAGFGRRITYITNPKILDMESTRSELAPADDLFRTGASHQYETTNMMYSKHWGDQQSGTARPKGGAQPALWKLATGIGEGHPSQDRSAPKVNSWITAHAFTQQRCDPRIIPPPLQSPLKQSKRKVKKHDMYVSQYMADTEKMAARTAGRHAVVSKAAQADMPARTQKLRNVINQSYNSKQSKVPRPTHAPSYPPAVRASQSGVAMIAMGVQPTKGLSITQHAKHITQ